MKKLLLASVLAIASFPGYAHAADDHQQALDNCDKRFKAGELQPGDEIGACYAEATNNKCDGDLDGSRMQVCTDYVDEHPSSKPPARVTITPPYQGPPPIGRVYGPYTTCGDPPRCSMGVVNVPADGLNVRVAPNGPPVMSLVNGVPLIPLQKEGDWLLVAAGCDLTPTFAWSWTAGVPLNRCWVYF
jgi:hypothetical protein